MPFHELFGTMSLVDLNELASNVKYIQNSNEQFTRIIDFEEWLECPECVKNCK